VIKKKVNRAGLIPFIEEDGKIFMLFMKPSNSKYGGDSWQMAKGKQEENETIQETAYREAGEELGLFKGNVEEMVNIGEWLGRTTVFVARIKDKDMFGDPHFETGGVRWMTLDEFLADGRDLHKPIVKAANRKILKLIGKKQGLHS
jgi:8-oxo-dGTP pyrophosphatase MutT (NUDIX family)